MVSAEVEVPRFRGVSHQIAFFLAVPVGLALAVRRRRRRARGRDRVRRERRGDVRREQLFHRIAWEPRAKLWLGCSTTR